MRLYLLPLGACRVDKAAALTPETAPGQSLVTPIWAALIECDAGWVLVDTGMHPVHISDPDATFRGTAYEGQIVPMMEEDDFIVNRLATVGVQPKDIRYVVSTHLHFDHCGGNAWFPESVFLLQRAEWEAAQDSPAEFHARDYAAPTISYQLIDGPYTVCPGVELIPTPGHTAGHQSVLVRLESRPVILPADAIVLREIMQGVGGAWRDPLQGAASVRLLMDLAEREGAEILVSHDLEAWEAWPHAPEAFV